MKTEKFSLIVKKAVEKKAMDNLNSIAIGHFKTEDLIKPRLISEKGSLRVRLNFYFHSEQEWLLASRQIFPLNTSTKFPASCVKYQKIAQNTY